MPPLPREEEVAIEAACREHEATHSRGNNKTACVLVGSYVVKYGDPMTLASYIETQSCLCNAQQQSNKLRIPQLIHHFDNGQGKAFVVIEAIKLVESPPDFGKRIVDTVTWLAGVPAPSDHKLGPLGGGLIRHPFFQDSEAPLPFVNVKALERYVEKGRKRLYNGGEGVDPVTLTEERLICVQASMDDSHFGVDEAGNTVMMGLGNVSFLPESFARYNFLSNDLFATLPESLGLSGATNMGPMAQIAHNLGMTGGPSLGLNKYGTRKTK